MTPPSSSDALAQDDPYIFGDPATDRNRLETQTRIFSNYIRTNAHHFIGDRVRRILDLGCGEGQLGFVLGSLYPDAQLVGIDKDEKAIAAAWLRAQVSGASSTEFIVGDIEQELPAGPFDLIYVSTVLIHTHQPKHVVAMAYERLRPAGYLWVKDFDPAIFTDPLQQAYCGGKYLAMLRLLMDTVQAIGGNPYCVNDLPSWMSEIGFVNIRREQERNPIGGRDEIGRTIMALGLGAFYNARSVISKVQGVPEYDLVQMYSEVIDEAMKDKEPSSTWVANVIAQKPGRLQEQ
jgi:SAM-dependent methyltransferase